MFKFCVNVHSIVLDFRKLLLFKSARLPVWVPLAKDRVERMAQSKTAQAAHLLDYLPVELLLLVVERTNWEARNCAIRLRHISRDFAAVTPLLRNLKLNVQHWPVENNTTRPPYAEDEDTRGIARWTRRVERLAREMPLLEHCLVEFGPVHNQSAALSHSLFLKRLSMLFPHLRTLEVFDPLMPLTSDAFGGGTICGYSAAALKPLFPFSNIEELHLRTVFSLDCYAQTRFGVNFQPFGFQFMPRLRILSVEDPVKASAPSQLFNILTNNVLSCTQLSEVSLYIGLLCFEAVTHLRSLTIPARGLVLNIVCAEGGERVSWTDEHYAERVVSTTMAMINLRNELKKGIPRNLKVKVWSWHAQKSAASIVPFSPNTSHGDTRIVFECNGNDGPAGA